MEKLYYIENEGCDATTHGLVRISDEDFPKFKSFVENLNKNSTYGCMPRIHVYLVDEDKIHPWTENDDDDELYLDDDDKLYMDGAVYTIDHDWWLDNWDKPLF